MYWGGFYTLAIMSIIAVMVIFKHYFRAKGRGAQFGPQDTVSSADLKPLLDQMERMEKRMRVLERIVTDKSHRLHEELSELED